MAVAAGCFCHCDGIFPTPSIWTSSHGFQGEDFFGSPRWPTVVGHRGFAMPIHLSDLWTYTSRLLSSRVNNNNNKTIWRGSVFTGEEPPPHSGELNHALSEVGGRTQSQPSRPMSSGHHISMKHRLRRKHLLLNPNTNASQKRQKFRNKRKTHFSRETEK